MRDYLSRRAALFNLESEFSCPDGCERLGCKATDLHISVTLVDLIALSLSSGKRAEALFREDCKMGFDPLSTEDPWVGRLSIELKKPCPFLKGKLCAYYPGRPLACALFPESFFAFEGQKSLLDKEFFKGFPCVEKPCAVSPKRKEALRHLMEMSWQEAFLSDFFLFRVSPFLLDLKNLAGEILEGASRSEKEQVRLPHHCIEELLSKRLAQGGYQQAWEEKIGDLDRPGGLDAFAEMKRQTDPIAALSRADQALFAYQFDGERLRPIRLCR